MAKKLKLLISDKNKHYNWHMGADMYLATSVILCDEMLKSYISPTLVNNEQKIDKRSGFTSANPDYEMLLPVVFNMKHGIELYLKALIMQINSNLEYPQSHDLILLLDSFVLEVTNKKLDNSIVLILDKNLRGIIEKYYFGLYAFTNDRAHPDICNEAERYPEYQNLNCYIIKDLYNINMHSLVNQIKKDCILIQKSLREDVWKKLYSN